MSLSNQYRDCQILDLDPVTPRYGPFVVVQYAVDPDDSRQQQLLYLLRRDGAWVECVTHMLTPESGRVSVVFDTLPDIVKLLQSLPLEPTIVRANQPDQARLTQLLREVEADGGTLAHICKWAARYRAKMVEQIKKASS